MAEEPEKTAGKLDREGLSLLSEGRIDEAIELFTEAIETDDNFGPSYLNRAEAYRQKGKSKEADQDEIAYNTLAVGGSFDTPLSEQATDKAVLESREPPEAEPAKPAASAPVHRVEEAKTAEAVSEKTSAKATRPESVPTPETQGPSTRVPDSPADIGELERPWQEQEEEPEMEEKPEQGGTGPSRPVVEVRSITFGSGGRGTGAWSLNDWGFRDSFTYWTVERFLRTILLMAGLAVIGVLIGKISFCPEDTVGNFWTGCGVEILVFSLGGAALGGLMSLFVTWGLRR